MKERYIMNKHSPIVGDIIQSEDFAYGFVGNFTTDIQINSKKFTREYEQKSAYNPAWAQTKFLVIKACAGGGGTSGVADVYADGWNVEAIRLDDSGKSTSDRITFIMSDTGSFDDMYTVKRESVNIIGHHV
jgi:hypothetical protein